MGAVLSPARGFRNKSMQHLTSIQIDQSGRTPEALQAAAARAFGAFVLMRRRAAGSRPC